MVLKVRFLVLLGLVAVTLTAVPPALAAAPVDACQVLSAEQVSAAVGATVEAGTHVTPTFAKTCTWIVKDGGIIVTLNIQGLDMFNAGKRSFASPQATSESGVGDEAYYTGAGSTAGLDVKKGGAAFKVSIYSSKFSLEQRKAMEKTLAQQAASKF